MTFTVTYRNKDGLRTDECFEAESRNALFKVLNEKGIQAIRVADGATTKQKKRFISSGSRVKRNFTAWIGIAAVIAIIGAAWWYLASNKETPPPVERNRPHKSIIDQAVTKSITPKVEPQKKDGPPWPEKSPHPDGEWRHGEGPRSIAITNGCLVTYPHCPGVQMVLPHPAFAAPFETLLDNEIARIISAKAGDSFIDVPLPKDFDEKFAESLLVKIEINDEDTPEKAELKRQVLEARKILVEAVKRGESPRQILTDEAKNLRHLMQTRDNFQRIIAEQIESGASDQEINDTVNAANQMLEQKGIEGKIMLPWKTKLRLQRGKEEGTISD